MGAHHWWLRSEYRTLTSPLATSRGKASDLKIKNCSPFLSFPFLSSPGLYHCDISLENVIPYYISKE
jgi:hypothetical protein